MKKILSLILLFSSVLINAQPGPITPLNVAKQLAPTAVKTVSYLASFQDYVPVDCSGGSFTLQLPALAPDRTQIGVKMIISSGTNSILVKAGASDVFNKAAGSTTLQLLLLNQGQIYQYKASTGIWYAIAENIALSQLDARYTGTATAASSFTNGGNSFGTNTTSIGNNDNTSLIIETNGISRMKFDSVGIVKVFSTTATSTNNGSFWYNAPNSTGFNFYSNDATNNGNIMTLGNSVNSMAFYADHSTLFWLYTNPGTGIILSNGGSSVNYLIGATGNHGWAVTNSTSGSRTLYSWSPGNNSNQTASTPQVNFLFSPAVTQFATGALSRYTNFEVQQPFVSFVGASTLSEGASMTITGPPKASTNAVITNASGLNVGLNGVSVTSGVTNGFGITCNAPTGATNNYSARFLGGNVGIGTSAPIFSLHVIGTLGISGAASFSSSVLSSGVTQGIGYAAGSGSTVTQASSRTTGVTINAINGAITLVSAAGLATYQTFQVTNSSVAATDVIILNQKSGTDLYIMNVTNVAAGSFKISYATTGGVTVEQPVFSFAVIKAVSN